MTFLYLIVSAIVFGIIANESVEHPILCLKLLLAFYAIFTVFTIYTNSNEGGENNG